MKLVGLCAVLGVAVVMSGCGTGRVTGPDVVSTTTTETTVTTTVVETTTVTSSQTPAQTPAPEEAPTPVSVAATPAPVVAAPAPAPVAVEPAPAAQEGIQPIPAEQGGDILKGARKPCSTIAADAPKFVDPEKRQKGE